jgi:hypothetical protein
VIKRLTDVLLVSHEDRRRSSMRVRPARFNGQADEPRPGTSPLPHMMPRAEAVPLRCASWGQQR